MPLQAGIDLDHDPPRGSGSQGLSGTSDAGNGFSASTLAAGAQVVFSFRLSASLIAQGIAVALVVGLIGGLFPAFHAARMPIVAGLYR